jgi:hypothetical protein
MADGSTSNPSGFAMPLTFDVSAWQHATSSAWTNSDGDAAILNFFDLPPDLPAALEDLQQLREAISAGAAAHGAGLVELDVITLDGLPAVQQIAKLRDTSQETGVVYIGSFTVPRANCSVVLRVQCFEVRGPGSVTGLRDAIVLDKFLAEHPDRNSIDDIMAEWAQHPYASGIHGGLPRNRADDQQWDEQFPDHPLSRARRTLAAIRPSIRLHHTIKQQPAFRGPAA